MKVRFDPKSPQSTAEFRRAAPNTFMAISVPLVAAASPVEAVRIGYKAMTLGADAMMYQWNLRCLRAGSYRSAASQSQTASRQKKSDRRLGLPATRAKR